MKSIYRVTVEVVHMEGSQLPEDCGGAFVNVYLASDNIKQAIDRAENQLLSDSYKPVETSSVFQIDPEDFDSEAVEEGDPSGSDLQNILNNGGTWYAAFNLYPSEKDYVH